MDFPSRKMQKKTSLMQLLKILLFDYIFAFTK